MKVTNEMLLAYQVDLLWNAISNDPRFLINDPKTGKPAYTFAIRNANSREIDLLADIKEDFEKATTKEDKIKVLRYINENVGADGAIYKTSEHTNNGLIPGQNYIFAFLAKSKENIAKSLLSIQDVHNNTEKIAHHEDYTYGTMIFALDTQMARRNQFQGTYGKVWGDYCLTEFHIPSNEYDPTSLLNGCIVPDLSTWVDNHYKTRDLDELIEMQKSAFIDKNDPLNFANFKKYIESNPNYHSTHSMVCDLYEEYFADIEQEQEETDPMYDKEDDRDEDYDESKDFSVLSSEEEFMDGELKEIVNGIIHNSSYSRAQKQELLTYYSQMMGDRITELAAKGGFEMPSQDTKQETPTEQKPPCQ